MMMRTNQVIKRDRERQQDSSRKELDQKMDKMLRSLLKNSDWLMWLARVVMEESKETKDHRLLLLQMREDRTAKDQC